MAKDKKRKKKCCGKFVKKGKHCSSCPVTVAKKKDCKADKAYCDACSVKQSKKKKSKKSTKQKKKKK